MLQSTILAMSGSYKSVLKKYNNASTEVRWYFNELPKLIPTCSWEVCLAYMFIRVEKAQNRTLYCGVVKLHQASTTVATRVIEKQHLTRQLFIDLFKAVFGKPITASIEQHLKSAEKTRDRVVHGKKVSPMEMRTSIEEIIDYAELMNAFVHGLANFRPFGNLQGFKGRGKPLKSDTTRWLLKGLGFAAS